MRTSRSVWAAVVAVVVCVGALLAPGSASATTDGSTIRASVPGELSIIEINARQQQLDVDDVRLGELVSQIRARAIDPNDGRAIAPDVLVLNELYSTQAPKLEADLNASYAGAFDCAGAVGPCPYAAAGTNTNARARVFINTRTVSVVSTSIWTDVCDSTRTYEIARLKQLSTDKAFTVAGIHLSPTYNNPSDCRQMNVDTLRNRLAGINEMTFVAGDFNKRAMLTERECDPEENSGTLAWWDSMTASSATDGHSYSDSVRTYRRSSGLQLGNQWTHEQPNTNNLCDGSNSYKRGRIDYVFDSEGIKTLEARVDQPGWAVEQTPGAVSCSAAGCKYSDHRFLWCRYEIAPMPPVDPINVTASALSSSAVDVAWHDVTNETSYRIERSLDGTTWTSVGTGAQDATSYRDDGLNPSTTYRYRVVAVNGVGASKPSSEALTTTKAGDPPATPNNVTATATSSTRIDISWADVAGESSYKLQRLDAATSTWGTIGTLAQDVISFADTSVKPGTSYKYRVIADNGFGSSQPSAVATATTPADTAAPTVPQNLRLSATKASVSATWSASTDAGGSGLAGYEVWRRLSTQSTFSLLAKTTSTTYSDKTTKPGKTYYYYVKAYDNAGNHSGASTTVSIKSL